MKNCCLYRLNALHTYSETWIPTLLCHSSVLSNSATHLTAFLIIVARARLHLLEQSNLHSQSCVSWSFGATRIPPQLHKYSSQHHSSWMNPWNTSGPIPCSKIGSTSSSGFSEFCTTGVSRKICHQGQRSEMSGLKPLSLFCCKNSLQALPCPCKTGCASPCLLNPPHTSVQ